MSSGALEFKIAARCSKTRARASLLRLKRTSDYQGSEQNCINANQVKSNCVDDEWLPDPVKTPIFMPVGTNGTMKGLLPEQIERTGCRLMLSNTYHLGIRPGIDVIKKAGGLHNFMKWPHGVLTDSGGFQMVSLSKLMTINDEEAVFTSPYDEKEMHLPPEESIRIQHGLGSNIVMQLDDVISSTANDRDRYEKAVDRSVAWLDRCVEEHKKKQDVQNLFPIIQGGLDRELRVKCREEMTKRDTPGIAIGGLSGGEEKAKFVEMVAISTENLPDHKPRYLMGVGFTVDMVLSVALGIDMFDCVFPTRTARFGTALVNYGQELKLKRNEFNFDYRKLEEHCDCSACQNGYSRSYLNYLMKCSSTVGCHLLSEHNINFQLRFMNQMREAIIADKFVDFMKTVLDSHFESREKYPDYVIKTFELLGIE